MPTIPDLLHRADPAVRERLVRSLPERQMRALARAFSEWAHGGQLAPATAATGEDWRSWVLMAGRGFGNVRSTPIMLDAEAHSGVNAPGRAFDLGGLQT